MSNKITLNSRSFYGMQKACEYLRKQGPAKRIKKVNIFNFKDFRQFKKLTIINPFEKV